MEGKSILRRIAQEPVRQWLVVILITGVGAVLRLVALDALPPGLYRDEAYNGLDALQVLAGRTPIFFEANHGREPLYIYLLAASITLWGRSPGALRLVSALVGILTIPSTYWLGAELFDRRVGTLAAILAATSVWTLNLSRIAFRTVALPPLVAVSLALLWRGLRRKRLATMVWGGIAYGLTFYTYLAARFSPAALILFAIYLFLCHKKIAWARGWLAYGVASVLVAAPLGIYFLEHWPTLLERAGQVSVFHRDINQGDLWGTLAGHVWRVAGSMLYRGDFIPRHNVPLRPIFGLPAGIAFLGGAGLSFFRARREPAYGLVIIWVGIMFMPTILAEDAPHMLRACGVLPVLYLFPALGLAELPRIAARRGLERLAYATVCTLLAIEAASGIAAYDRHLQSRTAYYNFEAAATEMAVELNRYLERGWQGVGLAAEVGPPPTAKRAYIAPRLWENWPSVRYLCPASDSLVVLPSESEDSGIESSGEDVLLVLWPYEDNRDALSLLPRNHTISVQEGGHERGDLETESRLLHVSIRSVPTATIPRNAEDTWEEGIRLLGYRLQNIKAGQQLLVELYWQATERIEVSYTVFTHVLCNDVRIGQHDGLPAQGYCPTNYWRAGDVILDRHVISLSEPYDPRVCHVEVGLYQWETRAVSGATQRLRLLDEGGQPGERTSVTLH